MADKDLKNIVNRIVDLPTLPQVVTTIMALIEDPDSSAKDINDVMANDPALAGKILKLVNSAFYGLPNRVSSIQQAITILGFNTIKSLAISASVFDLFGSEGDESFNYEKFWKASVGCATIARFVAKREPGVNPDTMFVVGLLHGMGKLVLDQYAPVEFQEILELARSMETSFVAAESQVLNTSYADIGFWLTQRWQLAEEVQEAIRHQDRIPECPDPYKPHAAILAFSKYICRAKDYGLTGDFDTPHAPVAAWDCLHIEREQLPNLIEHINEELEGAEGFLSVIGT